MKKLIAIVLAVSLVLTLVLGSGVVLAGKDKTGNGAPSGSHYNLNLIGVKDKDADMTGNNGHRIFVKLWGNTKIWLTKGDDFQVLDANGTDGNGAKFMLPDPDPTPDIPDDPVNATAYSVYIRVLGKPWRTADMRSFIYDSGGNIWYYSGEVLNLERKKGKQSFENVSKELLTVYVNIGEGLKRYYLFDPEIEGLLWGWDYQNKGLKLAQLRFYPIPTSWS